LKERNTDRKKQEEDFSFLKDNFLFTFFSTTEAAEKAMNKLNGFSVFSVVIFLLRVKGKFYEKLFKRT